MTAAEYTNLRVKGIVAEATINGTTRGGFVLNGTFYAHAGSRGIISAPVSSVSALRYI